MLSKMFDIDDFNDEDFESHIDPVKNLNLDVPIRAAPVLLAKQLIKNRPLTKSESRNWRIMKEKLDITEESPTSLEFSDFFWIIEQEKNQLRGNVNQYEIRLKKLGCRIANLSLNAIKDNLNVDAIKEHTTNLELIPNYAQWSTIKDQLLAAILHVATPEQLLQLSDVNGRTDFPGVYKKGFGVAEVHILPDLIIHVTSDYVGFHYKDKTYLGTFAQLLMIKDALHSRCNLLRASDHAAQDAQTHYLTANELIEIFKCNDEILYNEGNNGYGIIGLYEPFCTAVLQKKSNDQICDKEKFYNNLMQEFQGIEMKDSSRELFLNLLNKLEWLYELNPSKVTQAAGLFRLWGHPVLDIRGGIQALKSIAQRYRPVSEEEAMRISCKGKEIFCTNYWIKNKRWPNLNTSKLPRDNFLRKTIDKGRALFLQSEKYDLMDWQYVDGEQTFTIEDNIELSMLIDDKSLSPDRETLLNFLEKDSTGNFKVKSVILDFLKQSFEKPKDFLQHINDHGFPEGEDVIGACPKEQELKIFARFFVLLTSIKRKYIVLTEWLLAKHILPYFPGITMMDDEAKLVAKILANTRKEEGIYKLVTNMDFQKWNQFMRLKETYFLWKFLGQLFGLENIFIITHEGFTCAVVYLADGSFIPKINKETREFVYDDWCWSGHIGGMEGMRQKGWTIFTCITLLILAKKYKFKLELMGQGDNQVLIFYFYTDDIEEIRKEHAKFMEELQNLLSVIGPPLKVEETWSSSTLYMYSKRPVLNGSPLAFGMKKLCRLYPFSNEGLNSLTTALSSISANCAATIAADFTPLIGIYMYFEAVLECLYWNIHYSPVIGNDWFQNCELSGNKISTFIKVTTPNGRIRREVELDASLFVINQKSRRVIDMSDRGFVGLVLCPSTLGGLPILTAMGLICRGHPDQASEDIAMLRRIYKSIHPDIMRLQLRPLIKNILSPKFSDTINPAALINDPTSINTIATAPMSRVLTSSVLEYLKKRVKEPDVKNQQFADYIELATSPQSDLEMAIWTMRPFDPRLAHEIVRSTPTGMAYHWVSQFSKTGTLVTKCLFKDQLGASAATRAKSGEILTFQCVLYQLSVIGNYEWNQEKCSTRWIQFLREKSWGFNSGEIVGVTVASILESMVIRESVTMSCSNDLHPNIPDGYITLTCTESAQSGIDICNPTFYGNVPFFGTDTSDKLSEVTKRWIKKQPGFLRPILYLVSCINWVTRADSNLANLIVEILKKHTDIDIDWLICKEGVVSGSPIHRFQDTATEKGGLLSILYNIVSGLVISTTSLTKYSKGGENVNLNFQSALLFAEVMFSMIMYYRDSQIPPRALHMHINCPECIWPIDIPFIDCAPAPWGEIVKEPPNKNPYCYYSASKEEEIIMLPHQQVKLTPVIPTMSQLRLKTMLNGIIAQHTVSQMDLMTVNQRAVIKRCNLNWLLKANIHDICIEIAVRRSLQYFLSKPTYKSRRQLERFLRDLTIRIKDEPDQNYVSLEMIALHDDLIDAMVTGESLSEEEKAEIKSTLSSDQWSSSAFARSVKFLVSYYTFYLTASSGRIRESLLAPSYSSIPINLINHPLLIGLWKRLLLSSEEEYQTWGSLLTTIYTELNKPIYHDSYYLLNPLKTTSNPDHELRKIPIESLNLFKEVEWGLIKDHPDGIAKSLPMFKYDSQDHPLDMPLINRDYVEFKSGGELGLIDEIVVKRSQELVEFTGELNSDTKLVRPSLGPSSAPWKLIGLMGWIKPLNNRIAIVCGDGSGGYSYILCKSYPRAKILFNTLVKKEKLVQHSVSNYFPAFFSGDPRSRDQLIGLNCIREGVSDITEDECYKFWDLELARHPEQVGLLICDAEGTSSTDREKEFIIVYKLLKYAGERKINQSIIKVYSGGEDWHQLIISLGRNYYRDVKLVRSLFSHNENSELFLLCNQLKEDCNTLSYWIDDNRLAVSNIRPAHLQTNAGWSKKQNMSGNVLFNPCISSQHGQRQIDKYSAMIPTLLRHNNTRQMTCRLLIQTWKADYKTTMSPYSGLIQFIRGKYNLIKWTERTPTFKSINFYNWKVRQDLVIFFIINCAHYSYDINNLLNRLSSSYIIGYTTQLNQHTYIITDNMRIVNQLSAIRKDYFTIHPVAGAFNRSANDVSKATSTINLINEYIRIIYSEYQTRINPVADNWLGDDLIPILGAFTKGFLPGTNYPFNSAVGEILFPDYDRPELVSRNKPVRRKGLNVGMTLTSTSRSYI